MIVFLSRLFYPHRGGVERHVHELSKRLLQNGEKVLVVTGQYKESLPLDEKWEGINIKRIPYSALKTKLGIWKWMVANISLFRQAKLTHVHDVFWWYWSVRFLLPVKRVYITFHGYEGSEPPNWKAVIQRKAAEVVCFGSICVGDFMRTWYWARPKIVLYGAANLINQSNRTIKTKQAGFWGRFDYDTGIDTYVEAMKSLKNWNLNVYGAGPIKNQLPPLANVTYHSWESDVTLITNNIRYAFVSRYLSIIEAMQAKKLVVSVYNNRIKQDYLSCHPMRDNIIIAGSAWELVNKLTSLTNEQEETMIKKAHEWSKEQTWEAVVEKYQNLWQK